MALNSSGFDEPALKQSLQEANSIGFVRRPNRTAQHWAQPRPALNGVGEYLWTMPATYPNPSSAAATAVMRGNRKRDTLPELAVRSALHRDGLRFRKHYRVVGVGQTVEVDVCFTRQRLALLIDGCFWHGCPQHGTTPRTNSAYWGPKIERNRARDQAVDAALTAAGWHVMRVWEHESAESAVARTRDALEHIATATGDRAGA